MQYYHFGYVNYNNNGPNNGMNCENGFHVYCHMYIHFRNEDFPTPQPHGGYKMVFY